MLMLEKKDYRKVAAQSMCMCQVTKRTKKVMFIRCKYQMSHLQLSVRINSLSNFGNRVCKSLAVALMKKLDC